MALARECYNLTAEEGEEDPCDFHILESEGQRAVVGPEIAMLDVAQLVGTQHVNIGSEAVPKFSKIGVYWDDDTISKVTELLHEYQDPFPTKFLELKVIVDDLGLVHITLKPDTKLIKQCPYLLKPKYKEKVREEI